jgi:hypothetical protein
MCFRGFHPRPPSRKRLRSMYKSPFRRKGLLSIVGGMCKKTGLVLLIPVSIFILGMCVISLEAVPTASVSVKSSQVSPSLMRFDRTAWPDPFIRDPRDAELLSGYIAARRPQLSEATRNILVEALVSEAERHGIDPKLVAAVMSVESAFNPTAYNRGAMGLGQLMRGTAAHLGISDPYSVTQNVAGTTRYIVQMLGYWEGHSQQVPLALSSYLLGPVAAKKQERTGFSKRVHAYVDHVLTHYERIIGQ